MSHLLLLTTSTQSSAEVLPALGLLPHNVKILPADPATMSDAPPCHAVLVDGRLDLTQSRSLTRTLRDTGLDCPLLLIVNEGGLAVADADWGMDDVIVDTARPAEIQARIRLATRRRAEAGDTPDPPAGGDGLTIDDATYSARIQDRDLDLTYTEFELLRLLARHPGRTFSREDLLAHVWGADYFAGTRIVDVKIRALHSKLGTDYRQLITRADDAGYTFTPIDGTHARRTASCQD